MKASEQLNQRIIRCKKCPRLIEHCRQVAKEKRKSYLDWKYWGKPVPNLGSLPASLLVIGLAPAAHGANRTGRMFTGDRSGDWLFRSMHRAGFCNQANSTDADDGLELLDACITAVCHCAPPQNRPAATEVESCHGWLDATIDQSNAKVFVALGQIAWNAMIRQAKSLGWTTNSNKVKFSHGAELNLSNDRVLIASYHPSQQNTFTGRLTEPMLDSVFVRAKNIKNGKS